MEIIACKLINFWRPTVNVLVDLYIKKKPSFLLHVIMESLSEYQLRPFANQWDVRTQVSEFRIREY